MVIRVTAYFADYRLFDSYERQAVTTRVIKRAELANRLAADRQVETEVFRNGCAGD